ncbi:HNH endonuclease [Flavobacterium phragmitis]|jgi:hypothetical protein|uniref:HNH endonuclease n=1 Tax=Flavobacterium phragmitis TaxID=739143 RepID=A0A1I1LHF1_9FLAO|nr:HNH endonuclease [Flavobacterium phragmitis]SFC72431.1 HNH endonuclease [Flavobacterium phragmitis]
MEKTCLWCKLNDNETTFNKKAHTIPKSLGGQNYNQTVCDNCNHFFGNATPENRYSIETALKETFCITRQRFLSGLTQKRKVGKFKSIFFDVKERNGKLRLVLNKSFLFKTDFQQQLCRNFKRGLVKMWFEEFDRQSKTNVGHDDKYDIIRDFSRYDAGDLPVIYFERRYGLFLFTKREAETPTLIFNRMLYLHEDEKFTEIEFLGHVFGFPTAEFTNEEFKLYLKNSMDKKRDFFLNAVLLDKLMDIDFTLKLLDK